MASIFLFQFIWLATVMTLVLGLRDSIGKCSRMIFILTYLRMKIKEVVRYRTFLYRTLRTTFPSFLNRITAVQFRTLYQCTADFTIVAFAFGRARAWWPAFAMLVLYAVIITIWKERIKNHTINTSIELYLLKKHTYKGGTGYCIPWHCIQI